MPLRVPYTLYGFLSVFACLWGCSCSQKRWNSWLRAGFIVFPRSSLGTFVLCASTHWSNWRSMMTVLLISWFIVVVVVVVVDSHIQRIVLATEETTVTQQVSHRPIKRQSRLWSQRGTKVNGSHHGDNPLLRPTGIQIATKSYAALQAMAPTNIKTVHQTSLLHSRATSIDSECCRLPTTSVLRKKPEKLRSNQFWSTSPSFSRPHILYRNKENRNTEVHGGGGLELVKPAREPASSRPKPCAFLKKPHESCPFAAPCGPRRKKNDRGQRSAFPSETSRFKPVILAHRGSALPWLVNDRAALRLRRIWCVPTR